MYQCVTNTPPSNRNANDNRGMWRSNIPVAIKQMKLQYEEDSDEFISEAQLLISLKQYVYIYIYILAYIH